MNEDIDFVITWVDFTDPNWQKAYNTFSPCITTDVDAETARYRDWGLLKYWFRGVEKFAPWVRYIHFITYGHVPEWLDTTNPKIKIVRHEDYIPSKFLPLFSSRPIELMMHRIPDLSEKFVYFNDDFYLIRPISPDYFFHNGKPCDMAVARNHHTMDGIMLGAIKKDMEIIKSEFDCFSTILKNPRLWFSPKYKGFLKLTITALCTHKIASFLDTHAPTPYFKSTFNQVWSKYSNELQETMSHRFRSANDQSHWLFRYWQLMKGGVEPRNIFDTTKVYYYVEKDLDNIVRSITNQKYAVVVINDNEGIANLDKVITKIKGTFENLLPAKSSFEK